jgi:hypothetical protein
MIGRNLRPSLEYARCCRMHARRDRSRILNNAQRKLYQDCSPVFHALLLVTELQQFIYNKTYFPAFEAQRAIRQRIISCSYISQSLSYLPFVLQAAPDLHWTHFSLWRIIHLSQGGPGGPTLTPLPSLVPAPVLAHRLSTLSLSVGQCSHYRKRR